jgi:hypothetical protein
MNRPEGLERLDELEAKLRREAQSWHPSPELEANLLREMAPEMRMPRLKLILPAFAVAAIAAMLLIAFWPRPKPVVKPQPLVARAAAQEAAIQPAAAHAEVKPKPKHKPRRSPQPAAPEFIRIPYTVPLGTHERAEIVRVELPVAALTATGLQIATADTGARAQADLIVGEDGMARAVRLISILNNQ